MEENLDNDHSKMGFGVMRYCPNPVCCVIDSTHSAKRLNQVCDLPYDYPVVATVDEAAKLGAEVLVLGIAPSGGYLPDKWSNEIRDSLQLGMSIVNGLHDRLNDRFGDLLQKGQWIWDVRQPTFAPPVATAQAATLDNKRVLMVGTDMSIGKMTAGLEIYRWLHTHGHNTAFLATGQIGITITGRGIPLDAFKLDHACGAVEHMVLQAGRHDVVFIEGQGSLLHPGSSATLSLLRGACPTHLIMCHRANMTHLRTPNSIAIPPLREFIHLNEEVAHACGSLTRATTIGVALNTAMLSDAEAGDAIAKLEQEIELPVADVVRYDPGKLGNLLISE